MSMFISNLYLYLYPYPHFHPLIYLSSMYLNHCILHVLHSALDNTGLQIFVKKGDA